MRQGSAQVLDIVGTVARLGLAAVWLISGTLKALDPDQTYVAVRAYDVLPSGWVGIVAEVLPWLEIAFGLLLLVGIGTRMVAGLSALLILVFVVGVTQAWVRGLSIDCGCFGGGGQVAPGETAYGRELLRDAGFLALAGWLLVRPRTLLSIDERLESRPVVRSGEGRD
ncbi:MauE/DoxX family redox-associated membrane protein [Pseudonocardia hispaniensis]|uniref:MauE/DoxX family redox-associated membrane protein n=1 Tax=Pseudonocardia hispaniensis TaxID=904933 RepID=A0ABW1J4T3_9PSEU